MILQESNVVSSQFFALNELTTFNLLCWYGGDADERISGIELIELGGGVELVVEGRIGLGEMVEIAIIRNGRGEKTIILFGGFVVNCLVNKERERKGDEVEE